MEGERKVRGAEGIPGSRDGSKIVEAGKSMIDSECQANVLLEHKVLGKV